MDLHVWLGITVGLKAGDRIVITAGGGGEREARLHLLRRLDLRLNRGRVGRPAGQRAIRRGRLDRLHLRR